MYVSTKLTSKCVISPSELPAAELPEYEPGAAELQAIEAGVDVDELLWSTLTLAAYERRWRELMGARGDLRARGLLDLDLLDEPVAELVGRGELERAA